MHMGRLSGRTGVCLLLAVSGVVTVLAAQERWWPACRFGDFDTAACLRLQDHRFDFLFVRAPWSPLGNAAELAGLGMLLLAAAMGMLPWLVLQDRSRLTAALSAVLSLALVPVAATQLFSGRAGRVVEVPALDMATVVWVFVWPVALVTLAIVAVTEQGAGALQVGGRLLLFGSLLLATPVPQILLPPVMTGYISHDTSPWAEAVIGVLLLAAAVAAWPATAQARSPRSISASA